jgi:hypothetical protein
MGTLGGGGKKIKKIVDKIEKLYYHSTDGLFEEGAVGEFKKEVSNERRHDFGK